ncbi:MAG TPA: DUF6265 family protein [Thermoanaerobaculia bacterium]|nr:DUF6265 family protein [Thermoanaerobaculia bacterium]
MPRQVCRAALVVVVLIFLLAGGAGAAEPHTVADLMWMAGRWSGTVDGMASEETWNPPLGGSIIGTFRVLRGGTPVFYELMAIEQEASGPVLFLRHFGSGLVDTRPDVIRLPLTDLTLGEDSQEAVFAGPDAEGTTRLAYRRKKDELTVVLDKTKAGKSDSRTFQFQLQRP